jgi:Helix-turn-helix domain
VVKHNENSYLSLREAADEIRVPVKSVYWWVQKRVLPATQIYTPLGKRAIRVKRRDLEVLLERSMLYEGATVDLSNKTLAEEITNERDSAAASKVSADTVEPEAEPSTLQRFGRFARLFRRHGR